MVKEHWDKLAEYIDMKINNIAPSLEALFLKYNVSDVGANIEAIKAIYKCMQKGGDCSGSGTGYIIGSDVPLKTENPNKNGIIYVNKDTGDIYVCIDNTVDNNVWMDVTTAYFGDLICDTPEITLIGSGNVDERRHFEVHVTNYNSSYKYGSNEDIVTKIKHIKDDKYRIYVGNVLEDTTFDIGVIAYKEGMIASKTSNKLSISIKDTPETEDDVIINSAFEDNEYDSDKYTVANDIITAKYDDAYYIENTTKQGEEEYNWSSYQTNSECSISKMVVLGDTDKDYLYTTYNADKNENLYIINDENEEGLGAKIDASEKVKDTTNTLDMFGDNSCIACYQLNNNATDLSSDYDGTDLDIDYIPGKYDQCGSFNGSSSKIDLPSNDTLMSAVMTTISFIFKVPSTNESGYMFNIRNTGNNSLYSCSIDDSGNIVIAARRSDHWLKIFNDDIGLLAGKWCHVCITTKEDDSDGYRLYAQGKLISTFDESVDTNYSKCAFGYNPNGDNAYYEGQLDQIRVFNRAVTDDEVKELYSEAVYKLDMRSNNLESAPTKAYKEEISFNVYSALTEGNPSESDFKLDELDSISIDTDTNILTKHFKKVSDYGGDTFQRKVVGIEKSSTTKLKTYMWKDA